MNEGQRELFESLKTFLADRVDPIQASITALATDLDKWRPDLESKVIDLQTAVPELQKQVNGGTAKPAGAGEPSTTQGVGNLDHTAPGSILGAPPGTAPGQSGHCIVNNTGGLASGSPETQVLTPVNA